MSDKESKIAEIWNRGGTIIAFCPFDGLSDKEAQTSESMLIRAYRSYNLSLKQ
jgi:hypothetical protein